MLGIRKQLNPSVFRTVAAQLSLKQLKQEAALPVILQWNQNHFIVLYKIKGSNIMFSPIRQKVLKTQWKRFADRVGKVWKEMKVLLFSSHHLFLQQRNRRGFKWHRHRKSLYLKYFPLCNPQKSFYSALLGMGVASFCSYSFLSTHKVVDTGINTGNLAVYLYHSYSTAGIIRRTYSREFVRSWIFAPISVIRINLSILTDFIKLMKLGQCIFSTVKTGDIL